MTTNMKLDPTGVGDVEVDVYQNLKAGQRILLWYSDDTVWHEALVGLVVGGEGAAREPKGRLDSGVWGRALGTRGGCMEGSISSGLPPQMT